MSDVVTPRLLYKGAADETAETCKVDDQAALEKALKDGWRLQRVDKKHKAPPPDATDTIDVPAQKLVTKK